MQEKGISDISISVTLHLMLWDVADIWSYRDLIFSLLEGGPNAYFCM
jgi:hypothetical protein